VVCHFKNKGEFNMKNTNSYATSIVDYLVTNFCYSETEAHFMVEGYYSVIERIGMLDNPQFWAAKIDEAMKFNITPDMWHAVL